MSREGIAGVPRDGDVADRGDEREIDVGDGLRLHVTCSGTGPPLVLLHGFTGSGATWESLRATAGARHATITVDLAGHGRSGAPPDPARYALDRFADDLAGVLDTLGIGRAAVLGYSLGGRAALRFALRHPDRVAALVLESASPGIADATDRAARRAADDALAETIERDGVAAFVAWWERLPMWASQAVLLAPERTRLHAQRLDNRPLGLANSLRGSGAGVDPPVIDQLGALAAPTLIVAGSLDEKYVAIGQLMEAGIPGAQLAIVPDSGHAAHLERPAAFAALVTGFLDRVAVMRGSWR